MRIISDLLACFSVLLGCTVALCAQQKSSGPSVVPLRTVSSQQVPFVWAPAIVNPILCSSDGTIFVRAAASSSIIDLISIAPDGKKTVRFSPESITDITSPKLGTYFVTEDAVFVLTTGFEKPRSGKVTVPTVGGETQTRSVQVADTRKYFARFKKDGSYSGSVRLDLGFRPLQFGVFPSGDFLVAGINDERQEPRAAIVKSDGTLLKILTLEEDIHSDEEEFKQPKAGALPGMGDFTLAIASSQIVADGTNLILVRKGVGRTMYSVSAGGLVTPIKLRNIKDAVFGFRSESGRWTIQFMSEQQGSSSVILSTVTVDPGTRAVVEEYSNPIPLGFGLACVHGDEFAFLRRENDATLTLLRAVPIRSGESSPEGSERPNPK